MNRQQTKALKESIKHWERMLDPENWQGRERPTGDHCPCCITFSFCGGCPIQQYNGKEECIGTPYYEALEAWSGKDKVAFNKQGKKMVKLLKKILKEDS